MRIQGREMSPDVPEQAIRLVRRLEVSNVHVCQKKLKLGLAPTDEMGIILSCAFGKSATDWQIPR